MATLSDILDGKTLSQQTYIAAFVEIESAKQDCPTNIARAAKSLRHAAELLEKLPEIVARESGAVLPGFVIVAKE